MNVDQWENTYSPRDTGDEHGSWDGKLFETYGKDEQAVIAVATQEPRRVWTLVDTDNGLTIMNGYHYVNRVGYFITEEPWHVGATIDVTVTDGDVFA